MFILKLLRDQGFPMVQLNIVFQALILNKVGYAMPGWSEFLSAYLISKINGLLKCCFNNGDSLQISTVEHLIANCRLLKS